MHPGNCITSFQKISKVDVQVNGTFENLSNATKARHFVTLIICIETKTTMRAISPKQLIASVKRNVENLSNAARTRYSICYAWPVHNILLKSIRVQLKKEYL